MKKSFNIIATLLLCSLLLFQSLVSTGCCRINGEVNALTLKSNFISQAAINPPRRFFFGIKGYVSNMVMIIPFPPIIRLVLLLDLPLEALADLLMIPVDSIVYLHYLMNPPLSLLIEKHKNDQLETMLKKGIDPNKADYRYDPGNTLAIARASNNSTAAKLLLEYGAKLPANAAYFFDLDTMSGEKVKIALYALRAGIPREIAQHKDAIFFVNQWIRRWIRIRIRENAKQDDGQLEFEVISLLLKHGFPVNNFYEAKHHLFPSTTVLDEVLMERRLKPEDKAKMVALLRSCNARTYSEICEENPSLPHLDVSGIDVAPQFKPVVEILGRSRDAAGFRVSASFSGIEGPLLVFDYLPVKEAHEGKSYTTEVKIHRRISSHEWNQTLETVEIPTYYRIILTSKGHKMPSQIDSSWPRDMVIEEIWCSLETCEMYVVINPQNRKTRNVIAQYPDLEAIALTMFPYNVSRDTAIYSRLRYMEKACPPDYSYFFNKFFEQKLENGIEFQEEIDETVRKANQKTAELGLPGKWRVHSFIRHCKQRQEVQFRGLFENANPPKKDVVVYVYSSMRTFEELLNSPRPLAPFPKEILVLAPRHPSGKYHYYRGTLNGNLENGGYWNSSGFSTRYLEEKKECYISADILYGDDVPQEHLNAIKQVLVELYNCTL